jgi:hypothetical protein
LVLSTIPSKVKKKEKFLNYIAPRRTRTRSNGGMLVAACGERKLRNLLRVKQFRSHGVMVLKNDSEFFKSVERRA